MSSYSYCDFESVAQNKNPIRNKSFFRTPFVVMLLLRFPVSDSKTLLFLLVPSLLTSYFKTEPGIVFPIFYLSLVVIKFRTLIPEFQSFIDFFINNFSTRKQGICTSFQQKKK